MSVFKGKTVMITGATGLIGSHLVEKFMHMGDVNVIALSRSKKKLDKAFNKYLDCFNFHILAQNVCDKIYLKEHKIDFIFHAAGPMERKIISDYPLNVIEPNLIGTINCLECLREQKQTYNLSGKLILFSSVTVYGNNTSEDIDVTEDETRVTDSLDAVSSPYSQSKRMSEVIARSYLKQYETDVVIARLSTVYGDAIFVPETAFYEFICNAVDRNNITLNSSNAPKRDNIFIDDAVDGLLCIAENGDSGEAYNISSNGFGGNYAAIDEIAELIAKASNSRYSNKIFVQYKEHGTSKRKPGLKLNNSKLKSLGWTPTISLEKGIYKTIDYYEKIKSLDL